MKLFGVLVIFSIFATSYSDLFYDPINEMREARSKCTEDASLTPECHTSCVLEKTNMLTPSGDAINPNKFTKFYKQYAESCFAFKSKPTCEEADIFAKCYYNKTKQAKDDTMKECLRQYPQENPHVIALSEEMIAKDENLACFTTCLLNKFYMFNDDDKIDLASINPDNNFEFDTADHIAKCEKRNKQESMCQRKAMTFMCFYTYYAVKQRRY